jgi:hypothetical protein
VEGFALGLLEQFGKARGPARAGRLLSPCDCAVKRNGREHDQEQKDPGTAYGRGNSQGAGERPGARGRGGPFCLLSAQLVTYPESASLSAITRASVSSISLDVTSSWKNKMLKFFFASERSSEI